MSDVDHNHDHNHNYDYDYDYDHDRDHFLATLVCMRLFPHANCSACSVLVASICSPPTFHLQLPIYQESKTGSVGGVQ